MICPVAPNYITVNCLTILGRNQCTADTPQPVNLCRLQSRDQAIEGTPSVLTYFSPGSELSYCIRRDLESILISLTHTVVSALLEMISIAVPRSPWPVGTAAGHSLLHIIPNPAILDFTRCSDGALGGSSPLQRQDGCEIYNVTEA